MKPADFEEWLLGLAWSPELLAEQKRVIASTFARGYAADLAKGEFLGVAVLPDDDVPNVWRDVAPHLEAKFKPLHGGELVAGLLGEIYAKHAVMAEVSPTHTWLIKATLDADPEMAAPLKAKVLRKLEAFTPRKPLVCVHSDGRQVLLAVAL